MITTLECGCTVDDANVSTIHEADGRHYPLDLTPGSYCPKCDLYRPCLCAPKWDGKERVKLDLPAGWNRRDQEEID